MMSGPTRSYRAVYVIAVARCAVTGTCLLLAQSIIVMQARWRGIHDAIMEKASCMYVACGVHSTSALDINCEMPDR
jgi:hypothetical protein